MTTTKLNPTTAKTLSPFISPSQTRVLKELMRGEEGEYFAGMLDKLAARVTAMPKTGETDAQGDKATVYLHYFFRGMDWYITEKDMGDGSDDDGQHQAFGYANLDDPDCAEFGYISLPELFTVNAELDLHWTPKALKDCEAYSA
jgi:hypothetical protein